MANPNPMESDAHVAATPSSIVHDVAVSIKDVGLALGSGLKAAQATIDQVFDKGLPPQIFHDNPNPPAPSAFSGKAAAVGSKHGTERI
jgi:hypothetical protein